MTTRTPRSMYLLGRLVAALQSHLGEVADRLPEKTYDAPFNVMWAVNRATGSAEGADLIAPIMAELPADMFSGGGMLPAEGGPYWLGYYHQRNDLREGRGIRAEWHDPSAGEKNDAVLNVRLPAALKEWADSNGGAELVRQLLRDARAKSD